MAVAVAKNVVNMLKTPSRWSFDENESKFYLCFRRLGEAKSYIVIAKGFVVETSDETKLAILNDGREFLLWNNKQVACKA